MWAALGGHLELIKWWIASGREMDLGKPGNQKSDAIGAARDEEHQEVVALLEGFRDHPDETRLAVRSELNWYDEEAADRFAVVSSFFDKRSGLFILLFYIDHLPLRRAACNDEDDQERG